ncbi:hypothetical protein BDQ17DRAFT_1355871 [Cyathus striatus]|nr:hypothetical protein BDQ17DRAFT_1355871 [Cyathus striatus]
MSYSGGRKLLTREQRANPMGSAHSTSNTLNDLLIYDVKIPFVYRGVHKICAYPADFNRIYEPRGNMLEFTAGFDTSRLNLVDLRTAETVYCAHSEGKFHGNLGPDTFYFDKESITLLGVSLYGLAQETLDRIFWSPAHHYKAWKELVEEKVVPNEVMDLHSWGKVMVTLYSRRGPKASVSRMAPPTIRKPQEMPDAIWNVVVQCLDEQLNIQANMGQIVRQLAAAVGFRIL